VDVEVDPRRINGQSRVASNAETNAFTVWMFCQ